MHQNIRIENNYFKVYEAPLLSARSVNGLVFSNNTIEKSILIPGQNNKPSIKLTACSNVIAKDNKFNVPWKVMMNIQNMNAKQIKSNNITLQKN